MNKLALFIGILLCFQVVSATEDYSISFIPGDNGVYERIEITFIPEEDSNSVTYTLDNTPVELKASSGSTSTFEFMNNDVIIYDDFKKGKEKKIVISFLSKSLVEKIGNTNVFSFKFFPTENANLKVFFPLPKGNIISEIDPAISPEPTEITTDGRTIVIKWDLKSLNEPVNFIILYEGENKNNILIIVLILLTIVLVGALLYKITKHKTTKTTISKTLNQDERMIIDLLNEDETRTQKVLVKLTGFSKAKMSKIIRRLEEKEVVEKKPHMTTNKLILNKEFKK